MGKDREPKAAPKPPEPIVELGPDGKPKRPPRGHKQKGSGNVIVAKPPVVTGDGIILKAHERLPSQLLQEFCQREKKPNPRFFPNPPGHRMRVVIFDPKNNKNDMTFCPNQSFGSDSVARDFAALLALFHYQKTLPLERKMPEPYSTTWVTMLANERIEAATAKANSKLAGDNRKPSAVNAAVVTNAPVVPQTTTEQPTVSNSSTVNTVTKQTSNEIIIPVLDRNTADWLCESCGNNNFATLASGVLRTKCFKCQAAKTDSCVLVASTASVSSVAVTSSNKGSGSSGSSQSVASSVAKAPVMKIMKAAPAAAVNLKSDQKFFSKQDADNARNERIAAKKRKAAYFDALKRANKPMPVYLSQNLRRMLEAVLGLSSGTGASQASTEYDNEEEEGNSLTMDGFLADYSELVAFAEDACHVSSDVQQELLRDIAASLVRQGFFEHDVVKCMQLLLLTQVSEELLERIEATLQAKSSSSSLSLPDLLDSSLVRGVYTTSVTEATLSQLCIQLDESRLPVAFDPRKAESKPTFDVYKAPSQAVVNATATLSPGAQQVVNTLRCSGWALKDCVQAVEIANGADSSAAEKEIDSEQLLMSSLAVLSQATVMSRTKSEPSATRQQMSLVHLLSACASGGEGDLSPLLEEVESLEAIYGDKFASALVAPSRDTGGASFYRMSLEVDLVDAASVKSKQLLAGMYTLVVHVSTSPNTAGLVYPHCLPLISLQSDCASGLSGPQQVALTELQVAAWKKASAEFLGECMVFQICSFLLDTVDIVLSAVIAAKMLPSSLSEELTQLKRYVEKEERDLTALIPESDGVAEDASTSEEASTESSDRSSATGSGYSHGGEKGRSKGNHPFWTRNTKGRFNKNSNSSNRSAAYQSMQATRRALPAWNMRDDFLSLISTNRGLVVTGETGCGKTTQIPQFIHEEQPEARIVICQPRRLAAIGVATRIADEMDSTVGETVGYMVKGDSKAGANTRIVFCTYGVLLRRLQDDPTLRAVDYVILDEVHERGIDSDFTLALLMSAAAARQDLKVLLMSATIATERFAAYLACGLKVDTPSSPSVPVMFIPGFTFPVTEYYKNDFEDKLVEEGRSSGGGRGERNNDDEENENRDSGRPGGGGGYKGKPRKGDIDYDLLVRLIVSLCSGSPSNARGKETAPMMSRAEGSILVFVPGVPEINKVMTQLQAAYSERGPDALSMRIMPLHGNLSPNDQKRVFQPAGRREIKIIVATNVAEASITIPDVSVVVDTCRVKEMGFNQETQTSALMAQYAAQDSLLQRRGRAGRASQGRCFRMMSKYAYDRLPAHGLPEILRSPLDNVILQIKAMLLNMPDSSSSDSMSILGRCLDAPEESVVRLAEQSLVKIQALEPNTFGLTALGKHLSALPCSPRIGRLLIYGALLGCTYPTSCVAACLTARSPFMTSNDPETIQKVNAAKAFFGEGSSIKSDYNVIIKAMQQFEATRNQRSFCRDYGLSFERMAEIRQSQSDLLRGLVDIGFLTESSVRGGGGHANRNSHKAKLVAAVYCAGLYPQLAKVLRPPARFVEVMGSALERSAEAKEIKLYIPDQLVLDSTLTSSSNNSFVNVNLVSDEYANSDVDINVSTMQRVFMHPSTVNFSNISFRASNFVLYGERQLVVQPATDTYKLFLRDTTEVTAFALLFFGGKLETQFLDGIVTIDGWIRFSATGRIVALVQAIRRAFDQLLEDKILRPDVDISASPVLDVTCRLLETDGLG